MSTTTEQEFSSSQQLHQHHNERLLSSPTMEEKMMLQNLRRRGPRSNRQVFWRAETSLSEDDESSSSGSSSSSSSSRSAVESPTTATTSAKETSTTTTVLTMTAEQLQEEQEDMNSDNDDEELLPIPQATYSVVQETTSTKEGKTIKGDLYVECDVHKYMASREMTPFQERMNAITMIPLPLYCFFYLLSGTWISPTLIEEAHEQLLLQQDDQVSSPSCLEWSSSFGSSSWISWLMQNVHAMPPLPILAIMFGCTVHAPFSFLYHWKYAHALAPKARTMHWSRRMDQVMLHVCGSFSAFGSTGSFLFFWISVIFNVESIFRQFETKVIPSRNQARLGGSIVFWLLPVLRVDTDLFLRLLVVIAVAGYLFIKYPIGGWSHSAFHLVMIFSLPILFDAALMLSYSQPQLQTAAFCAAIAEEKVPI